MSCDHDSSYLILSKCTLELHAYLSLTLHRIIFHAEIYNEETKWQGVRVEGKRKKEQNKENKNLLLAEF